MMKTDPQRNNAGAAKISHETAGSVASIIEKIDNKIIQLLNCSSDDFLQLNDQLKKYHSNVTQIADNIERILQNMLNHNNIEHLETLKNRYWAVYQNDGSISQSNQKTIKEVLVCLKEQLIPLNNLRQDLKTLKLLFTNLQLEHSHSGQLAEKISHAIHSLNTQFSKLDPYHQLIHSLVLQTEKLFSDEEYEKTLKLRRLLHSYIADFEHTLSQADESLKILQDYKTKNKLHISNIVTNLQYQDIIRQKIEHIREIHKEIFDELKQIADSSSTNLNGKIEFFQKIKDIAGLQAAQLIHTNQEYQNAIQSITGNLVELAENMEFLSSVNLNNHNDFSLSDMNAKIHSIQSIQDALDKIHDPVLGFHEFEKSFQDITSFNNLAAEINELVEISNEILINTNVHTPNAYELIHKLKTTLDFNQKSILNIQNKLDMVKSDISGSGYISDENEFNSLASAVQEAFHHFHAGCLTNEEKIKENLTISQSTRHYIERSPESVKYYDLFEKVIEEIIDQLNTINLKLEYGDDSTKDKSKHLEYLRKKYTTASEHQVHEQIVYQLDSPTSSENNENTDDDNLELF